MQGIQIIITGDLSTGSVQVQGPIQDMRIVHWLLDEAKRVCERMANARDQEAANGRPQIIVAKGLPGITP